jgi:hypothetical protein
MTDVNANTALQLAGIGMHVFPAGSDKKPLCQWKLMASTAPNAVMEMFAKHPKAMPAIDCGKSEILVIDLDRHNPNEDGVEAFKALEAQHGAIDDAPRIKTPNNGMHIYFRQPDGEMFGNSKGRLPAGIDVRGIGGYVVAPGAVLPDGSRYELDDAYPRLSVVKSKGSLPAPPKWLLDMLRSPNLSKKAPAPSSGFDSSDEERKFIEEALEYVPADDRDLWLKFGGALHDTGHPWNRAVWDAWSCRSSKFDAVGQDDAWKSFGRQTGRKATVGSIIEEARLRGFTGHKHTAISPKIAGMVGIASRGNSNLSPADEHDGGPLPLTRPIHPGDEYPVDALGPILSGAVRAIQDIVKCPVALTAGSVLSTVSLAVMAHADVMHPVTRRMIPLSLFLLEIGESGERKSESDNLAMRPVREFEEELRRTYADEIKDYAIKERAWELAKLAIEKKGNNDRSKIERELRAHGEAPLPPLEPELTVTEPTFEALQRGFARGRAAQGLFSDEGGTFIGGFSMSEDAKVRSATGLSRLWDGKPIERVRASEKMIMPGRRLAVHLMAQWEVASIMLSDGMLAAQGYLARFLVSHPPSTKGSRFSTPRNGAADAALAAYYRKVGDILRQPAIMAPGERNSLSPRALVLTDAAEARWIEFSDTVEGMMGVNGELRRISAFASKLGEHVLRIAGVLTLIDDVHAQHIQIEALERSISIADYYMVEQLRIYEAGHIPDDLRLAIELLDWLQNIWTGDIIGLVVVYQRGPRSIRSKKVAKAAIQVLVDHNWLVELDGGHVVDGKKVKLAWRIIRESE